MVGRLVLRMGTPQYAPSVKNEVVLSRLLLGPPHSNDLTIATVHHFGAQKIRRRRSMRLVSGF